MSTPTDFDVPAALAAHATWLRSASAQDREFDPTDADLRRADLAGADVSDGLLGGTLLDGAHPERLVAVELFRADLRNADLFKVLSVMTDPWIVLAS
ncbi:MAG: hypothetical protein ACRDYX_05520 [Egibacteraceae bacterium]